MNFINRFKAAQIARSILAKQKGEKQEALSRILEDYETALSMPRDTYTIIDHVRCANCNGIILKKTPFFSQVTIGGNPICGCPVCKTFSSEMLKSRKDIIIYYDINKN